MSPKKPYDVRPLAGEGESPKTFSNFAPQSGWWLCSFVNFRAFRAWGGVVDGKGCMYLVFKMGSVSLRLVFLLRMFKGNGSSLLNDELSRGSGEVS